MNPFSCQARLGSNRSIIHFLVQSLSRMVNSLLTFYSSKEQTAESDNSNSGKFPERKVPTCTVH